MARARAANPSTSASATHSGARRAPPPAAKARPAVRQAVHTAAVAWSTTAGADAATATMRSIRVASITVTDTTFKTSRRPADRVAVLRRVLDRCVVPAEKRARTGFGSDSDNISAALVNIHVMNPSWKPADTSILGPLCSKYPAQVRSLQVLAITRNDYDESAELGVVMGRATNLQALNCESSGLTSVRSLAGLCEYLRKVNLCGCKHLKSLDGLEHHLFLEELDASGTTITSIAPLHTCPALTKVDFNSCEQLTSIEALEGHQRLQEVEAAKTPITSIEPLRTCPNLTKVDLLGCEQLSSLEGLEYHQRLQVVNASRTAIVTIEPLRTCPVLTKVDLYGCQQLSSIDALGDHQWLKVINASRTLITSVEALRTCPALTNVDLIDCKQLTSLEGLEEHQCLKVVNASETAITTVEPLRTCPALTRVYLRGCHQLLADNAYNFPASVHIQTW